MFSQCMFISSIFLFGVCVLLVNDLAKKEKDNELE